MRTSGDRDREAMSREEREEAKKIRAAYERACSENKSLRRRVAELEKLEVADAKRTEGARKLAAALADVEGVELTRQSAWIHRGAEWDGDDFEIPDGWPEGVTAESVIAAELGLIVREVVPRATVEPEPEPQVADNPFTRAMEGAKP